MFCYRLRSTELLPGFHDQESNSLLGDGVDIRNVKVEMQKNKPVVPYPRLAALVPEGFMVGCIKVKSNPPRRLFFLIHLLSGKNLALADFTMSGSREHSLSAHAKQIEKILRKIDYSTVFPSESNSNDNSAILIHSSLFRENRVASEDVPRGLLESFLARLTDYSQCACNRETIRLVLKLTVEVHIFMDQNINLTPKENRELQQVWDELINFLAKLMGVWRIWLLKEESQIKFCYQRPNRKIYSIVIPSQNIAKQFVEKLLPKLLIQASHNELLLNFSLQSISVHPDFLMECIVSLYNTEIKLPPKVINKFLAMLIDLIADKSLNDSALDESLELLISFEQMENIHPSNVRKILIGILGKPFETYDRNIVTNIFKILITKLQDEELLNKILNYVDEDLYMDCMNIIAPNYFTLRMSVCIDKLKVSKNIMRAILAEFDQFDPLSKQVYARKIKEKIPNWQTFPFLQRRVVENDVDPVANLVVSKANAKPCKSSKKGGKKRGNGKKIQAKNIKKIFNVEQMPKDFHIHYDDTCRKLMLCINPNGSLNTKTMEITGNFSAFLCSPMRCPKIMDSIRDMKLDEFEDAPTDFSLIELVIFNSDKNLLPRLIYHLKRYAEAEQLVTATRHAIALACFRHDYGMLVLLLEIAELDVNVRFSCMNMIEFLLHLYSEKQQPNEKLICQFIQLLLEKGATCCASSSCNHPLMHYPPLHNALSYGLHDVAKILLEFGADPNTKIDHDMLPSLRIFTALDAFFNALHTGKNKYEETLKVLKSFGSKKSAGLMLMPSPPGHDPILPLCYFGTTSTLQLVLRNTQKKKFLQWLKSIRTSLRVQFNNLISLIRTSTDEDAMIREIDELSQSPFFGVNTILTEPTENKSILTTAVDYNRQRLLRHLVERHDGDVSIWHTTKHLECESLLNVREFNLYQSRQTLEKRAISTEMLSLLVDDGIEGNIDDMVTQQHDGYMIYTSLLCHCILQCDLENIVKLVRDYGATFDFVFEKEINSQVRLTFCFVEGSLDRISYFNKYPASNGLLMRNIENVFYGINSRNFIQLAEVYLGIPGVTSLTKESTDAYLNQLREYKELTSKMPSKEKADEALTKLIHFTENQGQYSFGLAPERNPLVFIMEQFHELTEIKFWPFCKYLCVKQNYSMIDNLFNFLEHHLDRENLSEIAATVLELLKISHFQGKLKICSSDGYQSIHERLSSLAQSLLTSRAACR